MSKCICVCVALAAALRAQIPSPEDLETKAKRESIQEGLEVREIRESAAKDVGEALAKIDGISKLRKGAIANDVVLRGFQGSNINLLIDGVRIYGACPGHMDPAAFHVDFAEVERVEVTKGAFDIASQGSLGGSVNVIRKRSTPGFHLTPSLQLGSSGYYNPSLAGSFGNDRIEAAGGYSYRRSAPFRDGRGQTMTASGGYRAASLDDDAYRIGTGWASVRFSPAHNQSAEVAYTRQDGANILYPYLQMDSPYDIADRLSASYELRDMGTGVQRIRGQAYYTSVRHWMTDEKRQSSMMANGPFSMGTFAHTRAAGGRADIEMAHGFTAGVEAYQRNWNVVNSMRMPAMTGDQNVVPNVNTTVAGGYVDWNKSFSDRLRLGAGARIDTADMYVRSPMANVNLFAAYKGVTNLERRDTNPSANAHAAYGLTGWMEVFAGIATAVRVPDPQERFFNQKRTGSDWVGNPALRASRNIETNLGLNLRRKGFFLKPLVYYSSLGDFIVVHNQARLAMMPGVMNTVARSYENTGARMYGGELSFGAALDSRWLISGGLAYTRGAKDAIPGKGIYDTNLAEVPPLKGRMSVRYGRRLWFAQIEALAANAQRRVDVDLRELPTTGYATVNAKFGIHAGRFVITAGADNLFDRYYIDHLSYQRDPFRNGVRVPEPGRSLFLSTSYAF